MRASWHRDEARAEQVAPLRVVHGVRRSWCSFPGTLWHRLALILSDPPVELGAEMTPVKVALFPASWAWMSAGEMAVRW